MTTGTNPDAGPALRRWAAEVLGVREDASPAEARRAYLGKLRERDFLPPPSWRQALRLLDGAPAEPDDEWLAEEEDRLRTEVASFADEFFTLPAARRRERWDTLLSRCRGVPQLVVRLQSLKAGLEVESQGLPLDDSPRGRLAEQLLQTFPLPPLARAASRQAFLRRLEESSADSRKLWEKAARYLRAEWPAVAALDDELVRYVAGLSSRLRWRRKMHRHCQRGYQPPAAGVVEGPRWKVFAIVVGMALGVLRGFINSDNSSSSRAPSPTSYALQGGAGFQGFVPPRGRLGADPKTEGASATFFLDLPPIDELFDPSKYDLEVQHTGGTRFLRFTPRPDPATGGPKGRPVLLGEATLRLRGVSKEQIDAACVRAAERKLQDAAPGKPHEKTDPRRPKSAPGDPSRP